MNLSFVPRSQRAPLLVLLCAASLAFAACRQTAHIAQVTRTPTPPARSPDIVLPLAGYPFHFVAYGDVRFTPPSRVSELRFSNAFARKAIVRAIADTRPAFILMSGDLVLRGADAADWRQFERETAPWRDARIPLFPTLGNHEFLRSIVPLRRDRVHGLRNYYAHFPQLPYRPDTPWYSVRYANCYFLMLDSEDNTSDGPQMLWLKRQLDALPADIDFVFLVLHRALYTDAADPGHRPHPSQLELAHLLELRQQTSPHPRFVVISGHVHNYERFQRQGVHYIVSGGGGAHPHPLARGPNDLFKPLTSGETEYHYCVFTVARDSLAFQMFRLADGNSGKFSVRDAFTLQPGQN